MVAKEASIRGTAASTRAVVATKVVAASMVVVASKDLGDIKAGAAMLCAAAKTRALFAAVMAMEYLRVCKVMSSMLVWEEVGILLRGV
jgi:hypothetical protein